MSRAPRSKTEALDCSDVESVKRFEQRYADGAEELVSAEIAHRIIDGGNKVRVWREYRGYSVRDLAERAGVDASDLSRIECGESPHPDVAERLAAALALSTDDLV